MSTWQLTGCTLHSWRVIRKMQHSWGQSGLGKDHVMLNPSSFFMPCILCIVFSICMHVFSFSISSAVQLFIILSVFVVLLVFPSSSIPVSLVVRLIQSDSGTLMSFSAPLPPVSHSLPNKNTFFSKPSLFSRPTFPLSWMASYPKAPNSPIKSVRHPSASPPWHNLTSALVCSFPVSVSPNVVTASPPSFCLVSAPAALARQWSKT